MKTPIWEKRIPTLFALLLVAVSIFATGYLLQRQTSTVGQATPDKAPSNVIVGDITDTSFSVSFSTTVPVVAGVKVSGPNIQESVYFSSPNQQENFTHKILVPNLAPSSSYSFSLLLQGKEFKDGEQLYSVTTAPTYEKNDNSVFVDGLILNVEGGSASNTLVVLKGEDSQVITAVSDNSGNYRFDIANLRTDTLAENKIFTENTLFTIEAYHKEQSSRAQIRYKDIFSIPPITLSQNYNFGQLQSDAQDFPDDAQFVLPTPNESNQNFSVSTPKSEQSFIDSRPSFRGTSQSRTQITISIDQQPTKTVTSDANGRWQFRPDINLTQGEHQATFRGKDADGISKSIVRSFTIFPSGSQIAQSATPSATLTPTVTSTPPVTPSPSASPTPIPSLSIAPTNSPTATPIPPTVTSFPQPTTPPILSVTPTPPGSVSTLLVTFTSVILIVAGTALLFILG